MPANDCPGLDELTQYVQGTFPPESVRGLEMHVATCTSCEARLCDLDDSADVFLASLRRNLPIDQGRFLEESAYHLAVAAAAQLIPGSDFSVDSSNLEPDSSQVDSTPLFAPHLPFSRLGQYELISEIGRGGMGVVYKAKHTRLDRIAALKVLPAERLIDAQALDRFDREMKAVGRLQHQNIVQAFDADELDGVHFLAIEYVDGVNLSELLKQHGRLPIAAASELIRQAALGLQHAFEFGLVHRDIKPGNVMLSRTGQVKILDLGLALLHGNQFPESGEMTAPGQLMGTVDYMAPEQAESTHNVDVRADIYSLGATLYALLTGSAPFASLKYNSLLKKIAALANESVVPVRDRRADVPAGLAVVLHRMLSRQPSERFSTPAEVAAVLEPFVENANLAELLRSPGIGDAGTPGLLTGDTVPTVANAAGDTSGERNSSIESTVNSRLEFPGESLAEISRDSRRSPFAVGTGITVLLAFIAAILISIQTPAGTVVLEMSQPELAGAQVTIDDREVLTIRTGMGEEVIKVAADQERHLLEVTKNGFRTFSSGFVLSKNGMETIKVRLVPTTSVKTGSDGYKTLADATGMPIGAKIVRTLRDNDVGNKHTFWSSISSLAFHPTENVLAAASFDGTIQIWDAELSQLRHTLRGHDSKVMSVAFSPDGQMLVSGSLDTTAIVWDWQAERHVQKYQHRKNGFIECVAWSRDGKLIASTDYHGDVHLWNPKTGVKWKTINSGTRVICAAFQYDGMALACGVFDHTVKLINVETGVVRTLNGHEGPVVAVAFSKKSGLLASSSQDLTIRIWDTNTGAEKRTIGVHNTPVSSLSFSPDDQTLLSSNRAGVGQLWGVNSGQELQSLKISPSAQHHAMSEDGTFAAFGGADKMIRIVDLRTWNVPHASGTEWRSARKAIYDPTGTKVVSSFNRSRLLMWDVNTGELVVDSSDANGQAYFSMEYSADGRTLFTGGANGISMRNGATAQLIRSRDDIKTGVHALCISPDDRLVATGSEDGTVRLFDAIDLKLIREQKGHNSVVSSVRFSPDGQILATGCHDGTVGLWNPETGDRLNTFKADGTVYTVAFSPDGKLVIFADSHDIHIHNTQSWTLIRKMPSLCYSTTSLVFGSDNRWFASTGDDGAVRGWDVESGEKLFETQVGPPGGCIWNVSFAPGSRNLATANDNGTVTLLQLDYGKTAAARGITQPPMEPSTSEPNRTTFPPSDPQRRAVENVIKRGGRVTIRKSHLEMSIVESGQIPSGRLCLKSVILSGNEPLSDEEWNALEEVHSIESFVLANVPISTVGLNVIKRYRDLFALTLNGTRLTNASVSQISELADLQILGLTDNAAVTDDSCDELTHLSKLRYLTIAGTNITGVGLSKLATLPDLLSLHLDLSHGMVAADLAQLSSSRSLHRLHIWTGSIGDEDVKHIAKLVQLRVISLHEVDVSKKALAYLQQALPNCSIEHPALPTAQYDSGAARWSIDNGATINIHRTNVPYREMPQQPFVLNRISFPRRDQPFSAGLERLDGLRGLSGLICPRLSNADRELDSIGKVETLTALFVDFSDVSEAGLIHLQDLHQLEQLSLAGCKKVTDNAFAILVGLRHLRLLDLSDTAISDEGLRRIGKCSRLGSLALTNCQDITNVGFQHLTALPNLHELTLNYTKLTDSAIPYFQQMTNLRLLDITGTRISPAGAIELQTALPECVVFHESLDDSPWLSKPTVSE